MNCDHDLVLGETSSQKYAFFMCLKCFKAEPLEKMKNILCECESESNKEWRYKNNKGLVYIYCDKCDKIIK